MRPRDIGWGLLIALAVSVASFPAWTGSWVYDDWGTLRSGTQDGLDDLFAVFARSSADYIKERSQLWPFGVTYRPLPMLSLIAVQVAWAAPLPHHLVSLVLHLVTVFALLSAFARMRGRSAPDALDLALAGLFALHPLTIESYGWINGRSDVLAGAFLAGLACSLPFSRAPATPRALLAIAACSAGAALSKEPALVAVVVLLLAALVPAHGRPALAALSARWPALLAGALGLLCAGGARLWVLRGKSSGAQLLLADPELPSAYADALRLAIEHVLLPLPRAMLCLASALLGPAQPAAWAALVAVAVGLAWLIVRQRWRAAVLLAGAFAVLLPVLAVRHLLWLGFDRYLYIPWLLAVLALRDQLPASAAVALTRPSGKALVLGSCALLGASSFASARAYASQTAWLESLVRRRPDDPSGWVMTASWFLREGDPERARIAALATPTEAIPPVISHDLADVLIEIGLRREAVAVMERTFAAFPDRAPARFDALVARGMTGRFDDAYALARSLQGDPVFCAAARTWIANWLTQSDFPPAEHARAAATVHALRCPRPSRR